MRNNNFTFRELLDIYSPLEISFPQIEKLASYVGNKHTEGPVNIF